MKNRAIHGLLLLIVMAAEATPAGILKLTVQDRETQKPVAVRVTMIGPRGRPVPVRRAIDAGVGYAFDGEVELEVPSGNYQFRLVRGPEYRVMTGNFQIDRTAEDRHTITLPRFVDMQSENWLSGDLLLDQKLRDLSLLMRSEDLDVAALMTSRTDGKMTRSKVNDQPPGPLPPTMQMRTDIQYDAREGSGLLILGAGNEVPEVDRKNPSGLLFSAGSDNASQIVIANPFAWDLPLWLAIEKIDGFMLMGDFLQLDRTLMKVAKGRPAKGAEYNLPQGLGFYADDIYRNLLDAGFRVPPVAGSGAGLVKNPVGYNRVYVQCGDAATPEAFWDGLWKGRSVVTNGPLLRPRLDQQFPGHVFHSAGGNPLELQMDLQLGTRDPVDYLEVLYNGAVVYSARLEEFKDNKGIIPRMTFDKSGWVMVRVVTGYEKHYRAAVSSPWYIDIAGEPRISRRAVEFFVNWLVEREAMLRKKSPEYIAKVAPLVRAARQFWKKRLDEANAP